MEITGYKYTTEQEAIDARQQCAEYYGLPKKHNNVTKYYVDYKKASLDTTIFWYIFYIEGVEPILGTPTTFNVTQEEI